MTVESGTRWALGNQVEAEGRILSASPMEPRVS